MKHMLYSYFPSIPYLSFQARQQDLKTLMFDANIEIEWDTRRNPKRYSQNQPFRLYVLAQIQMKLFLRLNLDSSLDHDPK